MITTQQEHERLERRFSTVGEKSLRVVQSCKSREQFETAGRWISLALRKERLEGAHYPLLGLSMKMCRYALEEGLQMRERNAGGEHD